MDVVLQFLSVSYLLAHVTFNPPLQMVFLSLIILAQNSQSSVTLELV